MLLPPFTRVVARATMGVQSVASATMEAVAADPERRPRLLVLGAGPSQLGFLAAARAGRVWTVVCDRDPAAPGFCHADRRALVSTDDEPALERLAAALELDGVIAPGADGAVAIAARIAERYALPHPLSPATALGSSNKLRQREALAAAGVPQPRWQVVGDGEENVELEPPLVVKAPDRHGQKGLSLVEEAAELAGALATARAASRSGAVLVEEELRGPEVAVTGFAAAGKIVPLAVTDRVTSDPPAFGVALAELWPSPHAEPAAEVARRAVEALGIEHGPFCVHLGVGRGGPEVISVAARLGGDHEAELVEAATGVDLNALAAAAALGVAPQADVVAKSHEVRVGGAVTRFLLAPPGVLEAVEAPQGLAGVVRTWLYREPGYVFTEVRRRFDRAGAVLAVGTTREQAAARAGAAVERIRFATADAEALV
jgi:biotin carboxylase